MFNVDSWIRFIITELYALALMAFIFRRQILENKRNVLLKILLAMVEYLGLPGEVVNVLVHYCVERSRSRGAGRMPSMRSMGLCLLLTMRTIPAVRLSN